jgi:hypothetical protein
MLLQTALTAPSFTPPTKPGKKHELWKNLHRVPASKYNLTKTEMRIS